MNNRAASRREAIWIFEGRPIYRLLEEMLDTGFLPLTVDEVESAIRADKMPRGGYVTRTVRFGNGLIRKAKARELRQVLSDGDSYGCLVSVDGVCHTRALIDCAFGVDSRWAYGRFAGVRRRDASGRWHYDCVYAGQSARG